ncbi:MAG TPA: hypothetical protein VIY48_02190 [Candidatus Paceibacterota bacterium]
MHNETMKFKNPTEHTINLDAIGLDPIGPGETVDVPLHLAAPGRGDNNARTKSAIECVAPQLHPVEESDHKAWKSVPPAPTPISKIVSIQQGPVQKDPPGVKALREAAQAQAAKAAQKAQASASTPADKK